jgi:hypothetical protein
MTQGLAFIKPNRALKIWVLVQHFGESLVEGVSAIGWVLLPQVLVAVDF